MAILPAVALLLLSCEPKVEDPAEGLLAEARTEFENGKYSNAKMLIDSIKIVSPKAYGVQRDAELLRRKVMISEKERDVQFLENELSVMVAKRDSMIARLTLNKDKRFQDKGFYTLPSQNLTKSIDKNFMRASVHEDGVMYLTSYYRGKKIGHTTVKLSVGEDYAMCEKPFLSRSYVDEGVNNERCDYRYGMDNGLIDFILSAKGPIKVELVGRGGKARYTLRQSDIDAVWQMFKLAKSFEAVKEFEKMLDKARHTLEFLRRNEQRSAAKTRERNGEPVEVADTTGNVVNAD